MNYLTDKYMHLFLRPVLHSACLFNSCERCNSLCSTFFGRNRVSRDFHTNRASFSDLWFNVDKLGSMSRRELQHLCKKCGIKANSKTDTLLNDLRDFYAQHVADTSSILHYPFMMPSNQSSFATSKAKRKIFLPLEPNLDKNLNLFSPMESPGQWISGEVGKLNRAVKTKGIISKTIGEYKSITDADDDNASNTNGMYLTKNASVSAVLNCTSNKLFMISRWQKQQVEKMGKEKFNEYKKSLSSSGSQFHKCMNDILQGETDKSGHFPELISGLIQSVAKTEILKLLTKDKVLATEEYVTHTSIGYSGTFDGLVIYNGVPCVIEWKTSTKPRPTLESCYDAPLQVVAYAGAINSNPISRIPVTNCMIVIAHHDGSKADVHWMDLETCEKFWNCWLLKVLKYKEKTECVSKQRGS